MPAVKFFEDMRKLPGASKYWARLTKLEKESLAFGFFEAIYGEGIESIEFFPDFIRNGHTYLYFSVDVRGGTLLMTMCRKNGGLALLGLRVRRRNFVGQVKGADTSN